MDEAERKAEPQGETQGEKTQGEPSTEPTTEQTGTTQEKAAPKSAASGSTAVKSEKHAKSQSSAADTVRSVRSGIATAVWVLAVVAALILAAGALVIALDFNPDNEIVKFFSETADRINVLGELKSFEASGGGAGARQDALVKTVLVNWGICAIVYLVVGKILDKVIRP